MRRKRPFSAWIAGIVVTAGLAISVQIAVRPDSRLIAVTQPADSIAQNTTAAAENLTFDTTTAPDRNLNTADAAALKRVSGVGDILAEAIVAYRAEIGGFTRRQQLLEIDGIGAVLAARIMEEFEIPDELPPETMPQTTATEAETALSVTETTVSAVSEDATGATVPPYELNHVTRVELLSIPGMTETWADEILTVRAGIGQFSTVYELAAVLSMSGSYIKNVLFQYLYVDGETVLGREPESEIYDIRDAAAG